MGEQSALLGGAPLTDRDRLIRAAMLAYRTNFNGNPKLPFGPPRPSPPKPDLAGESNAWRTRTAAATFLTLIILVTTGRFCFWWRRRQKWSLGIDDVLILLAAGVAAAYVGHILSAFVEGTCLGRHMWFCTYEHIERLYMTFTIGQTIFYFSVYCSKLSLLFFIRRLTRDTSRLFNLIHWSLLPLLICCGLISLLGTAFSCTPVWARWSFITLARVDKSKFKCLNNTHFQMALRAMHISTDLLLLLYPASILKSLQMPLKKKIGIAFVFSFGLLCVMCSIVRNIIFGKKRPDYTYQAHDVYIWNMLDITSACIVPSLPAYYPVFNAVYRCIYGISTSVRDIAATHSLSSRSRRGHSRLDRHDTPNKSINLDDVDGSQAKNDPEGFENSNVKLVDVPDVDRPSDVPENYVRQVPMVRVREPKTKSNEAQKDIQKSRLEDA